MASKKQREVIKVLFDGILGIPLAESAENGVAYGEYDPETDKMYYGGACNRGLLRSGSVDYDHDLSVHDNIERLVGAAEQWLGEED